MLTSPGYGVGCFEAIKAEMDAKHSVFIDLKSAEMLKAERKLYGLDSRVRIPPIIQYCVEGD
ncbi:MAG: hypothetical protein ALECFALPRED_008394 [Alectoria fallacina]|uniref:Uncharacterized protein n=1 Tax=Alectoria fallacina TaxID=1903189 RepID=A0A8H3J3D6_9LECA|nr:MAG: hypothetical protein ALECFALPRED_008394 [Alectoria fallacina]